MGSSVSRFSLAAAAADAIAAGVAAQTRINGTGATFPYPIYSK